MGEMLSIQY